MTSISNGAVTHLGISFVLGAMVALTLIYNLWFCKFSNWLNCGFRSRFYGIDYWRKYETSTRLAPGLIGGKMQYQWIYWFAPILGAQLAIVYRLLS